MSNATSVQNCSRCIVRAEKLGTRISADTPNTTVYRLKRLPFWNGPSKWKRAKLTVLVTCHAHGRLTFTCWAGMQQGLQERHIELCRFCPGIPLAREPKATVHQFQTPS